MRFWAILALAAPLAAQQQQEPHAGFLYPAGGRQGSSVEVRLGGQYLTGASKVMVSGSGVSGQVVRLMKPPSGTELQKLRDESAELNNRRNAAARAKPGEPRTPLTAEEEKRSAELREILDDVQRKSSIPALAETVVLQVDITPDAAPGPRTLRLQTNAGLTNALTFVVGELPEITRPATRVAQAYNVVNGATPANRAAARPPAEPAEITLPAVVNAQMMPGVTDRYRFQARKGQRIVVAACARELIPYISDAVPGWFQASIALRGPDGRVLASADHFLHHPDPLIEYDIPVDGYYIAEIHDSIFRGREDFVYRLSLGELPVITSIFPAGGAAGKKTPVELQGWNLPTQRLKNAFTGAEGEHELTVRKAGITSNPAPYAITRLPETLAKPGIGRMEKAQRLKLPVVVNGRMQHGGTDFFRIDGKAGDEIAAEVQARRLGSPLDSTLTITDAKGKELAFNDDFDDPSAGLITHQADSRLLFRLPAKGTYYLRVADAGRKGGPEYSYRLRVSRPDPDFTLLAAPANFNLRAGATSVLTVRAVRRDGFTGAIALRLQNAPPEFVLSGATIPAGEDTARVTLSVGRAPAAQPIALQLAGEASIGGRQVTHLATPAEDMEQAFAYRHLVARDSWLVTVLGSGGAGVPWRANLQPVRLPRGAATAVEISVPQRFLSGLQLTLDGAPEGVSIDSVIRTRNGVTVQIRVQPDKAKAGLKGNLIPSAFREVDPPANSANRARRRQALGLLPAIPFEIVN